jgi:hypothetical protein
MKTNRKLFTLICGIFIVTFIIWNRVLRVREDHIIELTDSTFKIVLLSISLTLCVYLLIINIIEVVNPNISKISLMQKLLQVPVINQICKFYIEILIESPKSVFEFLYDRIVMRRYIEHYGAYITIYIEKYYLLTYILTLIVPRTIFTLAIFVDIFVFDQIKYINLCIIVLIIPLIFRTILYIISYCSINTIEYLDRFFIFEYVEAENKIYIYYRNLTDEKDIEIQNKYNHTYLYDLYFVHWENKRTIDVFYTIFDPYKPYYNIFIFTLLSLAFTHQLELICGLDFEFLKDIIMTEEPFSGLFI